jgi:hypothetical protein
MRIYELLAEGYREAETEFAQSAAADIVKKSIAAYRQLVNRNQVQGTERNIDWWRKQGWEKFRDFVNSKSTQPSATQVKRKRAAGNSITLKETDQWLIVIPLDHDASCFHGRDTDWCTARPTGHHFDDYFLDRTVNLIYLINKATGEKYAVASHPQLDEVELFDQHDDSMTAEQFKSATGFDHQQVTAMIPANDPRIAHARTQRRELMALLQQRMKSWATGTRQRDAELEQLLVKAKHLPSCIDYIIGTGKSHGPQVFPEAIALAAVRGEANTIIQYIKNPSRAVLTAAVRQDSYAIQFIDNPSPELQMMAVRQNGYAIQFVDDPSPELQMAAVQDDGTAIQVINNPSPELQMMAVRQNGTAIQFIDNPSPELQMAAVQDDGTAINYIDNPSLELQMAAVRRDGTSIQFIDNPAPEVVALARRQGFDQRGRRINGYL